MKKLNRTIKTYIEITSENEKVTPHKELQPCIWQEILSQSERNPNSWPNEIVNQKAKNN